MAANTRSRSYCSVCQRPENSCLCDSVTRQHNAIPVCILRHEDERNKALNTARILALGIDACQVIDGVYFAQDTLLQWQSEFGVSHPMLLYPSQLNVLSEHWISTAEGVVAEVDRSKTTNVDGLVVLDGTWRNTKEMILSNRWLCALDTLSIETDYLTRYRIRKSQQADGLATIEAVGLVLSRLDSELSFDLLLKPFHQLIEKQITHMGRDLFEKNYMNK